MNDKVLTMGILMFFLMIGVNGFLLMAANLYDGNGNTLDMFYGLSSNNLSQGIADDDLEVTTSVSASSTTPSSSQGFTPVTINDEPAGLNPLNQMAVMVAGVQLVMLKFGDLFPIISPITGAVVFFVTAIQLLVGAYLGGQLVRSIFGRII